MSRAAPQADPETVPELLRAAAAELGGGGRRRLCDLPPPRRAHRRGGRDSASRKSLHLGYGYLLSDYPLTDEVVREREPRTVSLLDPSPDPQEAKLLRELGFDSLLMLPLACGKDVWGLVEIYRSGTSFDEEAVEAASAVVARLSELLETAENARRR